MPAVEPHSALVRVTHWVNAISFAALVTSGVAILLAHPRLYWAKRAHSARRRSSTCRCPLC